MCFDIDLIVNKNDIKNEMICPIGHGIIDKRVALLCGDGDDKFLHIFCKDCINEFINKTVNPKCPLFKSL